jgi:hypothetical protein
MKTKSCFSVLASIASLTALIFSGCLGVSSGRAAFANFVTRSGDRLMDGAAPFRFMGVEAFDIHYMFDNLTGQWELPDVWEQEDGFKSIQHMGGTANRIYALSVRKIGESSSIIRHVNGPGSFNETVFRALDKAVQLAEHYNVRLIVSLVDGRAHWGGPADYAAFRGKPASAFWTDAQVKADFKATISFLLNRTNFYTGVQYKNDKTIFAWQLGNEMSSGSVSSTYDWMSEMAAYVKSIDANHLVASGHYVREQEIPAAYLSNPNIDIVDAHYYGYHGYSSLLAKLNQHAAITAGHRPMIVGEFGMDTTAAFTNLMDGIIANPNVAGGLLWNLRMRTIAGGYFRKDGQVVNGVHYRGYRWPGYQTSGGAWDERNALSAVRTKAYQIRGLAVPSVPAPTAPLLFTPPSASMIGWRGSTSAATYAVERAASSSGPWTQIASGVTDDRDQGKPMYTDLTGSIGQSYYYRVKAGNGTGVSGYSNVIGPIVYGVSNKAPSATLTVDSTTSGYSPNFAIDGIKNTAASRWVSTGTTSTHTFQMDWPVSHTIRNVKIWSGFPASNPSWQIHSYTLESWNGSSWVAVGGVSGNLDDAYYGQHNWITFPAITTHRLRLHITQGSATDTIARLCEIEVY